MMDTRIDHVLHQMRTLQSQVTAGPGAEHAPVARAQGDFSALLRAAIDGVNALDEKADDLADRFELGDRDVDLTQVMIADQKASLAFTAVTQVRNKLVTAYQDIMNMPV
jgi:flagellar hook-basal body complex protein FliE